MFDDEEGLTRRRGIIRVIPSIPLLLFVILFWKDVGATIGYYWGSFLHLYGRPAPQLTPDISHSLSIVGFNLLFGFLLFFLIWLLLFSRQALLPVSSIGETFQTACQLILYILFLHGPAIIVRDGKLHVDVRELRRRPPGVAVVDFNSAMVLERIVMPGCLAALIEGLYNLLWQILALFGIRRRISDPIRVCGPGLTFIQYDERIQGVGDLKQESGWVEELSGVVDLRRQFKSSGRMAFGRAETKKSSVHAYTRDGIELGANVFTLFTIGQDVNAAPHVLHVTYIGERQPENLRVVSLEEQNGTVRIRSITDELDPDDRREIHRDAKSRVRASPYQELPRASRAPAFSPARVFSAVYSRARSHNDEERLLTWTELPVRVAVDIFREILSQVNFDELYKPEEDGVLKVDSLRKELRIRMRNAGLLCYRMIFLPGGQPLVANQTYNYDDLAVSRVRELQSPKVLRGRGIQIITTGFGDLLPEKEVYLQWLASWRADWERDTTTARAVADLEAQRIYSRARAQEQQELAQSLREIFEDERNSREVIAIRILQALESIAADRETQRLLPEDTINMLGSIHDWLLPGDIGWR